MVDAVIAAAKQHNGSIALWALPGQIGWKMIVSFQRLDVVEGHSFAGKKGFVFSPFTPPDSGRSYDRLSFIEGDAELVPADNGFALHWSDKIDPLKRRAFEFSLNRHVVSHSRTYHVDGKTLEKKVPQDRNDFIEMVRTAIIQIEEGLFEKVVLARNQFVNLVPNASCADIFISLKRLYPDTLVSLVSTPEHGTWAGASPELLLEVDFHDQAHTMALAGTRRVKSNGSMWAWEEKEYHEHHVVNEYLQGLVRKMNLGKYTVGELVSHRVGELVHLRQDLQWQMEGFSMKEGMKVIRALHPTPAVCGQPKEAAARFIKNNEKFSRDHYAGFLGPVNFESKIAAFVNIRCMRLGKGVAELFAGAGITTGSIPEHEWEEINVKLKVMQDALFDGHLSQQELDAGIPLCLARD